MKYFGVILLVIFLTTLYIQRKPPVHPRPRNPLILAFGDSLTYGFGTRDPQKESYPARLKALSGQPVVNAGVNGETTAEGLRRIDALLRRHRPGLTILCLGGNDILQGIPQERIRQNLETLIRKIRASDSALLLVAVPHLDLPGLSDLSLYEELAEKMQVPLMEGSLGPILGDPSLKSDPIHPNAAGYRIMAERIYEKLKEEGLLYGRERSAQSSVISH